VVVAFVFYFGFLMTSAVILILAERKILAWMQDRVGPLHTGPRGLLQTAAEVGKLLLKEDIHPKQTDKMTFLLTPAVFLAPLLRRLQSFPSHPSWVCLVLRLPPAPSTRWR